MSASSRIARELFLAAFFPPQVAARILPRIASAMRDLWVPAGHVLFRAGEPADVFYFVVEGEVRIEGNDLPPLVLGERSVAGIIDVLADRARTRDGVVTKDAHLLELPSEEWLNVLEDDAEFARGALRNAARGAHAALLALVPDGGFPEAPEHEATPDLPALHLVERMLVLRSSPLVQRASAQALEELAETAKELRLEPGETLFERGDGVGRFCFVAQGTIALERDEPRIAARFGPGSLVGGVAAVTLDTEAYRAHAVTRAVVLDVDHDDLFDVVEEHFDLGRSLIVMVALENERLRGARARREGVAALPITPPGTKQVRGA